MKKPVLGIVCWALLAGFLYGIVHEISDYLATRRNKKAGKAC